MAWIFYALIALFFGYLLYDAFGKPVGRTKPAPRQKRREPLSQDKDTQASAKETYEPYAYSGRAPETSEPDIALDEKLLAPGADRALIAAGLHAIGDADDRFELDRFIKGAKRTLELMLSAFQARDREQLRLLLQEDLYEAFDDAISSAEETGDNTRLELLALGEPRLLDAAMEDTQSVIKITARLEQLVAKRDREGADVDALGETVIETAAYTFVRDVNSDAPNWFLRSIDEA